MLQHRWDVTISEATAIQKKLAASVSLTPLTREIRTIAGADISFARFSDDFFACMLVFSYPELRIIDRALHRMQVRFPYVPGYLSFREVPALMDAYAALTEKPDLIMMDGHGIAHPRRLGVATHMGLMLGVPTIGCGKSRLYGDGAMPDERPGSTTELRDPKTGEVIGAYLRTKARAKPVIISPGTGITLPEALEIARTCVRGYRIPEPTRMAHETVNAFRRGEI